MKYLFLTFIAAACVAMSLAYHPASAATLSDAVADLAPQDREKVIGAARAFLRGQPKANRSANDLGWDCQAAIALSELGEPGAKERLAGIADALNASREQSKTSGKAIGWAAAGDAKACVQARGGRNVPAACEGSTTIYAFQSGLAMACLARAGSLLDRPELIVTAKAAMDYWSRHRFAKEPCKECVYFATSDSAEDDERYIRNMNLFIAFGASEVGRATKDAALMMTAKQSVRSDIWERANGNRGYLGKLDPLWTSRPGEAERIENHSASMALLLKVMGATLGDSSIDRQAETVWRDWATCDNKRCQTAGCKYWAGNAAQCQATATAAHCAFRLRDKLAKSQCETYLSLVPSLGSYGLWAILEARP